MKKVYIVILASLSIPLLLGAAAKPDTITTCLDLAPKNAAFEINLHLNVNTTTNPTTKEGVLELSNDKGLDIAQAEQEAYKPVRECIFDLIG